MKIVKLRMKTEMVTVPPRWVQQDINFIFLVSADYGNAEFSRANVSTEFERELHVDCRSLGGPQHSGGIYAESLMRLLEVKTKLRWHAGPLRGH